MKTCTKCGKTKALEEFGKRGKYLQSLCRVCAREYASEYRLAHPGKDAENARRRYAADPEKARERLRRDYAADPERARKEARKRNRKHHAAHPGRKAEQRQARRAKTPYSPELAALMAELREQPCAYCGSTGKSTIDHIVPLARGGKHEADNLTSACYSCNSSKKDKLLEEWDGPLAMRQVV